MHNFRLACPECDNVEETDGMKMHQASAGKGCCVLTSPYYKEFTIKIDSKAASQFSELIIEASCNKCSNWKYTRPDVF